MKRSRDRSFKLARLAGILIVVLSLMLLFQRSIAAPVKPAVMPRIDLIRGQPSPAPPAYRLTISRAQDIVFVTCPERYAPKLGYLRNVEAIQCERF
jgi:hypothetical protein